MTTTHQTIMAQHYMHTHFPTFPSIVIPPPTSWTKEQTPYTYIPNNPQSTGYVKRTPDVYIPKYNVPGLLSIACQLFVSLTMKENFTIFDIKGPFTCEDVALFYTALTFGTRETFIPHLAGFGAPHLHESYTSFTHKKHSPGDRVPEKFDYYARPSIFLFTPEEKLTPAHHNRHPSYTMTQWQPILISYVENYAPSQG